MANIKHFHQLDLNSTLTIARLDHNSSTPQEPIQPDESVMKITINNMSSKIKPITLTINRDKTKIIDLARLYLNALNKQYFHTIEPTPYSGSDDAILPSDYTFYIGGHTYSASARALSSSNKILADVIHHATRENDVYRVYANLAVYRDRNYCLNDHIRLFSRKDPAGHNLTDQQVSHIQNQMGFRN